MINSRLATFVVSFLASILLAELVVRYAPLETFNNEWYHWQATYRTDDLNLFPEPNSGKTQKKLTPEGNVIFDVTYNFDSFGRRQINKVSDSDRAHLFFGCSFIFGEGLEESDTLPYIFSKKSGQQSFVYAFPGYGPNHMLAILNNYNIANQVPKKFSKVDVSFHSYSFHTYRYLGSLLWIGRNRTNDPYYKLIDGELKYLGNFARDRWFISRSYWILFHSKFFRLLYYTTLPSVDSDDAPLACALINESYQNLKQQLGERLNRFFFVISPFQKPKLKDNYFQSVTACLNKSIRIVDLLDEKNEYQLPDSPFKIHSKFDVHPNRLANDWLADKLHKKLEGFY